MIYTEFNLNIAVVLVVAVFVYSRIKGEIVAFMTTTHITHFIIHIRTRMVKKLHSQATKLTPTQVTKPVCQLANTPILTWDHHGSLRMLGLKPHPKFQFLKYILPNIFPVINRGYYEYPQYTVTINL